MHLVFLILLITLGGCLPDLIYRWRNRLRGTHQEGKTTGLLHTRGWLPLNMDTPHTHPGNHTHLHLLLRLLALHCVRGLTRPTSLALQRLDLLVEKSS